MFLLCEAMQTVLKMTAMYSRIPMAAQFAQPHPYIGPICPISSHYLLQYVLQSSSRRIGAYSITIGTAEPGVNPLVEMLTRSA